jgi:hypothetical protein
MDRHRHRSCREHDGDRWPVTPPPAGGMPTMPAQSHIDYYLSREAEERAAAAAATHQKTKDTHLDMAERYADVASMAAELEHDTAKFRAATESRSDG